MKLKFVICDIETTGLDEKKEIIEIALLTVIEGKIVEVFETLINPLCPIPDFVLNLTSINKADLLQAPKFYEVSEAIYDRLEGAVFVSHNVNFDLSMLKKKFQEMGKDLKSKSYCTLKKSQELIPGLRSYSLEALCSFFRIKNQQKHRAFPDAEATFFLFKELYLLDKKIPIIHTEHLVSRRIENIPRLPGVLCLKSEEDRIILKKSSRNLYDEANNYLCSRLGKKSDQNSPLMAEFQLTGTYLIAQLELYRKKFKRFNWGIQVNKDKALHVFQITPFQMGLKFLWSFEKLSEAKKKLTSLKNQIPQTHFIFQDCEHDKNQILRHNIVVQKIAQEALYPSPDLVLIGQGRNLSEKSLVLIRDQQLIGYGYTDSKSDEILLEPEQYLNVTLKRNPFLNLLALRYLKELKNDRNKNEFWREIPSKTKKSRSVYESFSL
jgi:DNA polymerase III epsilon subunit family exonuclease